MGSLKTGMQMFNLALSIMNKVQTMQHRQLRMANDLNKNRIQRTNRRSAQIQDTSIEAELESSTKTSQESS